MVATNLLDKQFDTLLQQLRTNYPDISFKESKNTYWEPKNKTIYYNPSNKNSVWSILHEVGHTICGHTSYKLDVELLIMEKDAWSQAQSISKEYSIDIDSNYVEDCLDSYREWLHKRSTCPRCKQTGTQTDELLYYCMNCRQKWRVGVSRFCRAYRRTI